MFYGRKIISRLAVLILALVFCFNLSMAEDKTSNLPSAANDERRIPFYILNHESRAPRETPRFLCGDANGDEVVNIGDAVFLSAYIFRDGQTPDPLEKADVDECGTINLGDVVYLVEFIFLSGPPPCEGTVTCYMPPEGNTIAISCPITAYGHTGDSVAVPVYLTSDRLLNGFSLGFHYSSDDIEITSIDLTGTVIPSGFLVQKSFRPVQNHVFVGWSINSPDLTPLAIQNNSLLFKMWMQVPPGTPSQAIDIDSVFIAPAGEFILIPEGGGVIKPNYVDCGSEDITIIYPDYICGDANGDEEVNVSDAVSIINYVFAGGNPPDPIESGDVNCDAAVNVSDAVAIINYIFVGGNDPCDTNGDGIPDC